MRRKRSEMMYSAYLNLRLRILLDCRPATQPAREMCGSCGLGVHDMPSQLACTDNKVHGDLGPWGVARPLAMNHMLNAYRLV